MKITVIGAGNIGATLGRLWAAAGHDIVFGVRHPERITDLIAALAPRARAVSPEDAAAADTEVALFAAPYGAWPAFAAANAEALRGVTVVDAANPYPDRDGDIAGAAVASGRGAGAYTATVLPNSHVVKAFNTLYWEDLRDQAHRAAPQVAVPIAADDDGAAALTSRLVIDAGFEPVIVGGLQTSARLDPGSPVYATVLTAAELRSHLLTPGVTHEEKGRLT